LAFSLCAVNADPDHLVNIAHPIDDQIHESKFAHKNRFAPISDVEDEGKGIGSVDDKENFDPITAKRLMEKAKKTNERNRAKKANKMARRNLAERELASSKSGYLTVWNCTIGYL
jgi:hypothetical protein